MSRIGKKPISVPDSVTIAIDGSHVSVKGPKGELENKFDSTISVVQEDSILQVLRANDDRKVKALHGLTRSLLANMVTGVSEGFEITLDLVGTGYRVQQTGEDITLEVGFSHPVKIDHLDGTKLEIEGNNKIHVKGIDKQAVGQMAALIRAVRQPNAYTGKGVRYSGEFIKLIPGKAAKRV